jgi:hypothetical protein
MGPVKAVDWEEDHNQVWNRVPELCKVIWHFIVAFTPLKEHLSWNQIRKMWMKLYVI